jgi:hypothetical protein
MGNVTNRGIPASRKPISLIVAKSIKQFSESRRNVVRGTVAGALRGTLASDKIEVLRDNHTEGDMVAAATILEGPMLR